LFALSTGSFVLASIATVLALLVGMVLLEAWGKRLGERHRLRGPASEAGYSAAETAVLGVLGLFVAVIIELEIPHLGLIRPQATDQLLIDLRRLMG
jgi:hypothetical protein